MNLSDKTFLHDEMIVLSPLDVKKAIQELKESIKPLNDKRIKDIIDEIFGKGLVEAQE